MMKKSTVNKSHIYCAT